ncbi:uncharacterized protein ACMZJ9_013066 [Mantella aurantiaca]
MGFSKGLGSLCIYIDAEEGVSFLTDNDMFWCSNCDRVRYKIHAQEMKDLGSKFIITLLKNGKILLKDFREVYVSWENCDGITYLVTEKSIPDELCEFEVFNDGEKVILKASNGLFVCRSFKNHGDIIEVGKSTMANCCQLRPGMGDLYAPCFDISSVELKNLDKLNYRSCILKKEVFRNKSDVPQSHDFIFTWETRTNDITQWDTTWGLNGTHSSPFTIMEFEATVTYNGTFKKIASTHRSIAEKRCITVEVPGRSKVTAQLTVSKMENASIPFTAFIRKTKVNGEVLYMEENGVWKGLVYDKITVETKQERDSWLSCTTV